MFSPDDRYIVSAGFGTVCIWDAETGGIVAGPFRGHNEVVGSIMFSPDGKRVASGSWDKTIFILDVETGLTVVHGPIRWHTDEVESVAFSPDGKFVVSGSLDETICIWHADTGTLAYGSMEGHTRGVTSVAFSLDGRRVVSGSRDQTIRIWEVETGAIVAGPFRHNGIVWSVTFSPQWKTDPFMLECFYNSRLGREDRFMRLPMAQRRRHIHCVLQRWQTHHFRLNVTRQFAYLERGYRNTYFWAISRAHRCSRVRLHFRRTANVPSLGLGMTARFAPGMWRPSGSASGPHKRGISARFILLYSRSMANMWLSCSADGGLCVLDVDTGALRCQPVRVHTDRIASVAFSHDGSAARSSPVHTTEQFASGMRRPVQSFLGLSRSYL